MAYVKKVTPAEEIVIPTEHQQEIGRLQRKGAKIAADVAKSTEQAKIHMRRLGYNV